MPRLSEKSRNFHSDLQPDSVSKLRTGASWFNRDGNQGSQFPLKTQHNWLTRLVLLCCVVAWLCPASLSAQDNDAFRKQRLKMVKEVIAGDGIENEAVLKAMRSVPRHLFVRKVDQNLAYFDQSLPIGFKQTISPPFVVSYMTQIIDPQPTDQVLEIGTGSGYQAAILSEIVDKVYTIEIVEPLGRSAARRLKRLGYENVIPKVGDGYQGWPEHAPFDKIIVTCSPEDVPKPLIDQLREGGKMIIPLGERHQQVFYLFEKQDGELIKKPLIPTLFVPMTGKAEDRRQVQPNPLRPELVNGGFEADENEDERADAWHYQRQNERVMGDAPVGTYYMQFKNETPGRGAQLLQGFAIDGSKIHQLDLNLWIRLTEGRKGKRQYEQAAVYIYFYDKTRRVIGDAVVGPWSGSFAWKEGSDIVKVPRHTNEAVLRVGLNGGTGILDVDAIRITPRK